MQMCQIPEKSNMVHVFFPKAHVPKILKDILHARCFTFHTSTQLLCSLWSFEISICVQFYMQVDRKKKRARV